MGIKVQYVGSRSYTEVDLGGVVHGFGRGDIRELPDEHVINRIAPMIENGSRAWKIVDKLPSTDVKKTQAMKEVIETVVEEVVEETPVERDYSSMTRAELMALCKEKGITGFNNTTKKADLIALLEA